MRATRALRELRTPLLDETELVSRPRVPRGTDSGIPERDRNCRSRPPLESMSASLSLAAITWPKLATGPNRIGPSRPSHGTATATYPISTSLSSFSSRRFLSAVSRVLPILRSWEICLPQVNRERPRENICPNVSSSMASHEAVEYQRHFGHCVADARWRKNVFRLNRTCLNETWT